MPIEVALSNVEIEALIKFHWDRMVERTGCTETTLGAAQEELDRVRELRKLCPSTSPHL